MRPHELDFAFHLDPRLGLFALESVVLGDEVYPAVSGVLSALVLAALAVWVWRTAEGLVGYIVAESAMMAPTVVFFVVVLIANIGPTHSFSLRELVFPLPIWALASGLPLAIAVALHVRRRRSVA